MYSSPWSLTLQIVPMGTWGRIVIVSGGRYWVKEVSHSGYLSCLGHRFASLVPREPAAAEAWVQKMKDIAAKSRLLSSRFSYAYMLMN